MRELTTAQRASYLRQLFQRYDTLSLPLGSGLNFSLIQVFQPLRLRQSSRNAQEAPADEKEHPPTDDEEHEPDKPGPPQQVLAENGLDALSQSPHGRLVILGGPGSGKTTVLKHLLYHHAHLALENPDAALPLFLSLPDLARSGLDLPAYLAQQAADLGLERDAGQAFVQAIEQGHTFVCLDSLDEVLPRQRAGIIRQINTLAHKHGNIWIVGSRFTDYKGGQFEPGCFQEWELQPLDEPRRMYLAAHLLSTIQRQISPSTSDDIPLDPGAYVRALGEHRQAASWGENPLLFSLAAVVYLRRGTLSGSRSRLYGEVIDAVLETRQPDPQQRVHLRAMLAEVSLELYQRKGRTFHASDLRASLNTINSEQRATWSVEATFTALLNSGVLDVVSHETYSFRHQTFQEYLVASALASRFMSDDEQVRAAGEQFAWSKHTYSRWHEIQRLLAGILVQEYGPAGVARTYAWLERLLQQQSSPEGDPGYLSLELAIKLLGEVAELENWQRADTLALEEEAVTCWVREQRKPSPVNQGGETVVQHRLRLLAPDLGHLRSSAQKRAITALLAAMQRGNTVAGRTLGLMHSPVVAKEVRLAWPVWQADPQKQKFLGGELFADLQEYAPLDLLLPLLETETAFHLQQIVRLLQRTEQYAPVQKLLLLLDHLRFETRQAAAAILIHISEKVAIPQEPLLALCQAGKQGMFEAACVLSCQRHPAALAPLLHGLEHEKVKGRVSALEALARLAPLAPLERIIVCLGDPEQFVRAQAIGTLGHWGQEAPLELLLHALKDPESLVRVRAIKTLGHVYSQGISIPMDHLLEMLHDPIEYVVQMALETLGTMGKQVPFDPILAMLASPHFRLVSAAVNTLNKLSMLNRVPEDTLFAILQDRSLMDSIAQNTLRALASRLPRSFLLNTLNDPNRGIAQVAAEILGQRTTDCENLLIDLANEAWPLRGLATMLLARTDPEEEMPLLLKALRDRNVHVSKIASDVLQKVADRVPQEALFDALKDPISWVRIHALAVLEKRRESPRPEPLIVALHDTDTSVRIVTARLFATWGKDAPLAALAEAVMDDVEEVRVAVVTTLGQTGGRNPALAQASVLKALSWPVNDYNQSGTFSQALAALSPAAPPEPLWQAFDDAVSQQDFWRLHILADALAAQGERMPVARLHALLHHPTNSMRAMALRALRGAGSAAPVSEIIELLDGPADLHDDVILTLNKLAAFVPTAVFLRIWREQLGAAYLASDVLMAIKRAGGQIPRDILAHITRRIIAWPPGFDHFLATLDELALLPNADLMVLLAASCARLPQAIHLPALYRLVVPRFPIDAWQHNLQSERSEVRWGTLLLGEYHPEEFSQAMLVTMLNDPTPQVQGAALERLRVHSAPLPVQPLITCLRKGTPFLRKAAIAALSILGSAAPLEEISAQLQHSQHIVRREAVQALGCPGLLERVSVDVVLVMTGDVNQEVRNAALTVLKAKDPALAIECCLAELGHSIFAFYRSETHRVVLEILQELAPAHIPELLQEARELLQGGKPTLFFSRSLSLSAVADTLGNMGRPVPQVLTFLGKLLDWPYWEVRTKAARALGKLRRNIPDDTIRRLLELRHDPRSRAVREAADEALAEILSLETGIEDD